MHKMILGWILMVGLLGCGRNSAEVPAPEERSHAFTASVSQAAEVLPATGYDSVGSTATIQTGLANAGYYIGAIDGKNGPMTRQAVRDFQESHQLQADGVVGPQTWAKLREYLH